MERAGRSVEITAYIVVLGVVGGVLAVFPYGGEVFKLVVDDLRVGSVCVVFFYEKMKINLMI